MTNNSPVKHICSECKHVVSVKRKFGSTKHCMVEVTFMDETLLCPLIKGGSNEQNMRKRCRNEE